MGRGELCEMGVKIIVFSLTPSRIGTRTSLLRKPASVSGFVAAEQGRNRRADVDNMARTAIASLLKQVSITYLLRFSS
jgi:hypothetical protein